MRYYSTRNRNQAVDFRTAALSGLAPDGGLYLPESLPELPAAVRSSLASLSFPEIAFETIKPFVTPDISPSILMELVHEAFNFDLPLVAVADRLVLELFHGPSAAFKDFGARFMARSFAYLRRHETKDLRILVATSGDTGGAVADGFFGVDGISVTVLYPKGRVSPLQERQIAGLGANVEALAVEGSFDDCQSLVKTIFTDPEVKAKLDLSSANSINICRLIPQAAYYVAAAGQALALAKSGDIGLFSVPSGNFGNLTAGLYAKSLGAPIKGFIAATNLNKTVPDYLKTAHYQARPSIATISNAMDVGAPSNFERMTAFWTYNELCHLIKGCFVTDDETRTTISAVYRENGYTLDPHSAVAWKAIDRLPASQPGLVLATAHPAKFSEIVEPLVGPINLPPSLEAAMKRHVRSQVIAADPVVLKNILVNR